MKRFGLVLAVFFVALFFAGCGKENDTIRIGTISPNTGALMVYGQSMTSAYEMAVEEINKSGGILGRPLELVIKDDKMEPSEAVNSINSLIVDGVELIIGSVTSSCTAAIRDIANQEQVLLISPTATEDGISGGDDYVFRMCFSDSFQGAVAALYAKECGYKQVGVLYCASDTYSKGIYDAFSKSCQQMGIEIVEVQSVADVALTQDYTNQWAALANSKVEYVFAPFYYYTVGPYLIPQARQAGYHGVIMGGDGYDGAHQLQYQTGEIGSFDNVCYINHYYWGDKDQRVTEFVESFKDRYGYMPDAFTALAYDSVYMLAEAIERAGSWEASMVREALADCGRLHTGVTGQFYMDKTGTPGKGAVILEYLYTPDVPTGENAVSIRLKGRISREKGN